MYKPSVRFVQALLTYLVLAVVAGVTALVLSLADLSPGAFWDHARHVVTFTLCPVITFAFLGVSIFALFYYVAPQLKGRPLHSPLLAYLHFWLVNAGVLLLAAGLWLTALANLPGLPVRVLPGSPELHAPAPLGAALGYTAGGPLTALGVALLSLSALLFAYNIWRTIR